MALRSGTSRTRTQDRLSAAGDWADDWSEPEKPQRDWKKLFLIGRPCRAVVGRDLRRHARAHKVEHGRPAAPPQNHHWLLGRDADDDGRVAARPDVLAHRLVHAAHLCRRLHLPDHHLRRVRLRLLLEGAGEPRGGRRARPKAPSARCNPRCTAPRRGSSSSRRRSCSSRRFPPRRPRSSATRARPAPTARPATAPAARCATRTPPASLSPPTSSRRASPR